MAPGYLIRNLPGMRHITNVSWLEMEVLNRSFSFLPAWDGSQFLHLSVGFLARNAFACVQLVNPLLNFLSHLLEIESGGCGWADENSILSLLGNEKAPVIQAVASPGCCRQDNGPAASNLAGILVFRLFAHCDRISECPFFSNVYLKQSWLLASTV